MKRSLCRSVFIAVLISASALVVKASSSANPEHVAAFKATKNCPACDLKEAQLGGVQAQGANLINADLTEASLYGGSLRGADLTGAILDRTDLRMVDMTGAVGAILATAVTDTRTMCPNGTAGPCS